MVEDVERLSREKLERLQRRRLRSILRLGYEKTRLYREKFKQAGVLPNDIKTYDDLVKIPFSSKEDFVKDHLAPIASRVSVWHTTSGTSGLPTIIGFSDNDLEAQTSIEARNLSMIGVTSQDVVHNVTPYGMFFAGICLHQGARCLGAAVIPAGKLPTGKQQAVIIDVFRPTVILGVPQFILKLSYVYEKEVGKDPRKSSLRLAYALGEPLPSVLREKLEQRWGVEVRIGYGLTEAGSAAECEERNGVHWPEDHTLVEVIDPKTGERVSEGEEGELVFTTLTRTGTLSIRFRSNDFSRAIFEKCSCGRTLLRVAPPKYRLDDLVKIRGTLTSPFAIDSAIFEFPEIRNYLLVVEKDPTEIVDLIKIFVEADYQDSKTVEGLAEKLGGGICVTPNMIKYVPLGSIPTIGRKEVRFIDLRKDTPYKDAVKEFMKQFESRIV
jgi:phenylacetate-CoA ligase